MPVVAARPPQDMLGLMSYRQATLLTGMVSIIFALMVLAHEVVIEGGFDLRNYIVVAFCFVWLIVDSLLLLGLYKKAHFLLLPWMILLCMLTPLFLVGIVAGCKVVGSCLRRVLPQTCEHEYHIFGTTEPTAAAAKLTMLVIILIINIGSILVVYKYFTILTASESGEVTEDNVIVLGHKDHHSAKTNIRYSRFRNDIETETNGLLCESLEQDRSLFVCENLDAQANSVQCGHTTIVDDVVTETKT